MKRALAALLVLAACGGSPTSDEPSPHETETGEAVEAPPRESERLAAASADGRCLPVVSGCGCAYACGWTSDATVREPIMVETNEDAAPVEATLEEWCEPQGVCRAAFLLPTICGGECIPTRAFDGCHFEGERCVP